MIEEHMAICEFTLLPCSKQCKDYKNKINHFMRKDLAEHLRKDCANRDYECEHCGEKGMYGYITQVHDDKCEKKVLPCPNTECVETLERGDMKRHLESCTYTEYLCKYRRLGCDAKMRRNNILAHEEEDKLHFFMALDKMIAMDEHIYKTKGSVMTFELTKFQSRDVLFSSPTFSTSSEGYRMMIEVNVDAGVHLSVSAILQEGEYNAELNWPFVGTITITLLNQLEDENHFSAKIDVAKEHCIGVGEEISCTFICYSELAYDPVKKTQYLKDDSLFFRVSVEVADHTPWLE